MTARRARGEGSVYFDAERQTWVGVVSLGRDPATGRRSRRKVSAATKPECQRKLRELVKAAETTQVPKGSLTVRNVIEELMASPPAEWRSPTTMTGNRIWADKIIAELGTVRVTRLTPAQVETMLRRCMDTGYSASTITRIRSVLRRALRRAQRDHGLMRNVADLADIPGGTVRRSRAMTQDQWEQLLAAADTSTYWRAWVATAIQLGMRPGELAGLRWQDTDFHAGLLRVRSSIKQGQLADLKTEQSRRTYQLPATVSAALKAHREAQQLDRQMVEEAWHDNDLVFPMPDGQPVHRDYFRLALRRLCKAAGIPACTPREMRHTFVSAMSEKGVPIEAIADAVGHVNSRVTQVTYRHQIRDTISSVATAWDGAQ